ncbi:MAG: hypothetical protein ACYTEG_06505 [Planctomycetota bacterium]
MVPLPDSGTTPVATAPPAERVRTDGHLDGPRPRWIEIRIGDFKFGAWCREGVWTPLDRRKPTEFVSRESWSKLGDRSPRRLSQVRDAIWNGPVARLRPSASGIDFVVELFEGGVGPGEKQSWHGATIRLPIPRQRSYRFEGSVPPGHHGMIAEWGSLRVELEDSLEQSTPPSMTVFKHGSVAGDRAVYEERSFAHAKPVERDYDGVLQAVFSLTMTRKAAGIHDGKGFGLDD